MSSQVKTAAVSRPTEPIAGTLAQFAGRYDYEHIPQPVLERAKLLVLDAVGIALASTRYPFAHHVLTGLSGLAGPGTCSVLGLPHKLPLRDAMVMNGVLVHGLDYDDTHVEAIVHPTASALPCALGMAEHLDASGRDLLAAYILGVEVVTRIGVAADHGFHDFGFHPTGIAAHFSCALQAGWLLRLSERALVCAQGLAGSTAAASQQFLDEGAWNKRVHPGWAGLAGVTAAYLAQAGFHGPSEPYEGRFGLFRSHLHERAEHIDYGKIVARLGEVWEVAHTAVKPFPICHFIHACADAALEIRRRHAPDPASIKSVRVLLPRSTLHIVAEPEQEKKRPANEYDAKFSAQYVVATCLLRGRFGLAELLPEALGDAATLALAARVECAADPESTFPKYFSGGVEVTLSDGRTVRQHEPVNRGAGERALSAADISDKFMENATLALAPARAREIRAAVLDVERMSARDFARRLSA
ncbi:MAG: MmgE/PrpD family protein [Burkholderiales bacterium]|nr:MmgE/PrpD family protein [Burkholderiales bacterium]